MTLNFAAAAHSLVYMGKGLLGIFVVIAIIYGLIVVLNLATNKRKKSEE